jgi:CRISPR-associated endonuclease/helicase Cas3
VQVLAKKGNSANPHANVTLWEHTADVLEASRALFGLAEPSRLCQQWFRFFKVPLCHWACFHKRLTLAALWHDTGKASCSFQDMLSEGTAQLIRHEYISFALFQGTVNKLELPLEDMMAISFAILGHHLKSGPLYLTGNGTRLGIECLDMPITVFSSDPGLQAILRQIETTIDIPQNSLTLPNSLPGSSLTCAEKWMKRLRQGRYFYAENSGFTPEFRALALALIASDSAGSGLRRTGRTITDWVGRCFSGEGLTPENLEDTIIKGRTQDIVQATGHPFVPNPLQKQAQQLGPRAVIVSPCGSGKTLAAWLWAQAQLKSHKASRVLFLYPTRNTATEGFRDYVSWGKDDASLLHGTAAYDLEGITFQGEDHPGEDKPKDPRHQASYRPETALYSLGYWDKRFISATVDSFLSFSANNYGADCLLPLLCDSLIVVDEVHSFDPQMFVHLCQLLEHCDLPVLVMTATLPKLMRQEFEKLGIPVDEAPDPDQKAIQERYHISYAPEDGNMVCEIKDWILNSDETKLLAVCNTVSRCQALGRELQELVDSRDDVEMVVYHSRFRLQDRQKIHEDVIRKFRDPSQRLVLLSTQVCQMSLDLDADSLFTEIAPLPDIIQRMGRVNRHGKRERGYIRLFMLSEEQYKPYTEDELKEAKRRLGELPALAAVSQVHLAELMASLLGKAMQDKELVPLFSNKLPTLEASDYRLGDDYTVDAVLPKDLEHYCQLYEQRDPRAEGLVVPVPFFHTKKPERKGSPRFLRVAKADTYTSFLGFCDKESTK